MKMKENNEDLPAYDFRCQTARLLMDLGEFKSSCKIMNHLIEENDEKADVWYMLAFVLLKLGKYDSSRECLKNTFMLIQKFKLHDPELNAGAEELQKELDKK